MTACNCVTLESYEASDPCGGIWHEIVQYLDGIASTLFQRKFCDIFSQFKHIQLYAMQASV